MNSIKPTPAILTFLFAFLLLTCLACEKLEIPQEAPSIPQEDTTTNSKEKDSPTDGKEDSNISPDEENEDSLSGDEEDILTDNDSDELATLQDTIYFVENWGDASEYAFTVHDVRHIIPTYFRETGASGMKQNFVGGYIVGCIPQNYRKISRMVFAPANVETNIVIADSPDETDYNECIAIQLSTSTSNQQEARAALNLAYHPENIGVFIIVHGTITSYMGTLGMKNVSIATIGEDSPLP